MVQNQMAPAYPQFSVSAPTIEDYQQQQQQAAAAAIATQAPTTAQTVAGVATALPGVQVATDPVTAFKTAEQQPQTQPVTVGTPNSAEQQTVSSVSVVFTYYLL